MGGVAGHLAHLYENGSLRFSDIKKIFDQAASGELEGTEKTDGQNLFVSYSVQTGRAKAARNKGNIKAGGMDIQQLTQKFAGHANDNLSKSFSHALLMFERIVQTFDTQTQIKIFGSDANVYYNAEIMDSRTPNAIVYDINTLLIHRTGHAEFDRETGNAKDVDVEKNAMFLEQALEAYEDDGKTNYQVKMNAVQKLRGLDDDAPLKTAISEIDGILSEVGLKDDATISEFLIARLEPMVKNSIDHLPEAAEKLLLQRILGVKGVTFNKVVKGVTPQQKEAVRALVKNAKQLMKEAVWPIERIIHNFSVEILRGWQSAFILDNNKETDRIRDELGQAIQAIKNSGNEEAMAILQLQLKKIQHLENISTAAEGFVFTFRGQPYKFTGNFAPTNQLVGLFKYGRGNIPAMVKEGEPIKQVNVPHRPPQVIALYPGGFKPPHGGHYAAAKHLGEKAEQVKVLISPKSRAAHNESSRIEISSDMSQQIWNLYTANDNNISAQVVKVPSPVGAVYDFIENEAVEGDTIVLGVGAKEGASDGRYAKAEAWAAKKGKPIKIHEVIIPSFTASGDLAQEKPWGGDEIGSGTALRNSILTGNVEKLQQSIPRHVNFQQFWNIVKPENTMLEAENGMLEEMSGMAGGAVQGYPGALEDGEKESLKERSAVRVQSTDIQGGEIPRDEMPQIKSTNVDNFRKWIKKQYNIASKLKHVPANMLAPTQKEVNMDKVTWMMQNKSPEKLGSKPLMVSNDLYILDGHHRWYAIVYNDMVPQGHKIPIIYYNASRDKMLHAMSLFPDVEYKDMSPDERDTMVAEIINELFNKGVINAN